jgi:ribosomal protein L19
MIEHSQNAEGVCLRNKKSKSLMSNFTLKFEYDTISVFQCFFYISPFIYFLKKKRFSKKKKIFFI